MLQLKLFKMIAELQRNIVEGVYFIKFGELFMVTLLKMKSLTVIIQKFY